MFIKFANTNGEIFESLNATAADDGDDDDYSGAFEHYLDSDMLQLGRVLTYPEGICIVDRDPNHTTTQLSVDDILELLRQLIYQMYMSHVANIKIHLPRMHSSMIKQAECQDKFQNILEKLPSPNADDMVSFVCSMSRKKMNTPISSSSSPPLSSIVNVQIFHV